MSGMRLSAREDIVVRDYWAGAASYAFDHRIVVIRHGDILGVLQHPLNSVFISKLRVGMKPSICINSTGCRASTDN